MRESVVFYRSFLEATEELPAEDFKRCVMAILRYGLDGEVPTTSGIEKTIFIMAKPQIDKNNQRYENGKKGGRPKNQEETEEKPNDNQSETKVKPKHNQTETEQEPIVDFSKPNVNVNVNVNENDNVNANALGNDLLVYNEVLAIAETECPVIHKRHTNQINTLGRIVLIDEVNRLLYELTTTYTYEKLRLLFRKANSMYCSKPKYERCDLVWLLNNLREIEQTQVAEQPQSKPQSRFSAPTVL